MKEQPLLISGCREWWKWLTLLRTTPERCTWDRQPQFKPNLSCLNFSVDGTLVLTVCYTQEGGIESFWTSSSPDIHPLHTSRFIKQLLEEIDRVEADRKIHPLYLNWPDPVTPPGTDSSPRPDTIPPNVILIPKKP